MKKLVCKIIGGDNIFDQLKGLVVTVIAIDRTCPYRVKCIFDPNELSSDIIKTLPFLKNGKMDCVNTDYLEPIDISDVPETHNKNPILINAWVFVGAKLDAWERYEPEDKEKYKEIYGVEWTDVRVWDINRY
jgi:hypothetical protein